MVCGGQECWGKVLMGDSLWEERFRMALFLSSFGFLEGFNAWCF